MIKEPPSASTIPPQDITDGGGDAEHRRENEELMAALRSQRAASAAQLRGELFDELLGGLGQAVENITVNKV